MDRITFLKGKNNFAGSMHSVFSFSTSRIAFFQWFSVERKLTMKLISVDFGDLNLSTFCYYVTRNLFVTKKMCAFIQMAFPSSVL